MNWPSETGLNAAIVQSPSIFGRQFLVDLQDEGLQTVLLDQADLAFETTIHYHVVSMMNILLGMSAPTSSNLNQPTRLNNKITP